MATDDGNMNGGGNNNLFSFYLALDSMKKKGILENDPDFEQTFEGLLKDYISKKKQMEAFQAFIAKNVIPDIDKDVAELMEKYRQAKELLLEIHTNLQPSINEN